MRRLTLAHLAVAGLTPPEIIHLAAETGHGGICLNPGIATFVDLGGPIFRIDNDPEMRRETARALADTGVTIDFADALLLVPNFSIELAERVLDVFGELGTRLFNVAIMDDEKERAFDNLEAVHALARARQQEITVEFFRLAGPVATLKDAEALATSGRFRGIKIMIDALHLARGGETPADVAAIDPALIGACQICDGPAGWPGLEQYMHEAIYERAVPGEGELPLRELLRVLPPDLLLSPEVPMKSQRDAGVPLKDIARRAAEGTWRVADQALQGTGTG